jgi:hypothetical protein
MTYQENPPLSVTPGAIRFNTDSMKLEYYRGGPVGFGTTTTTGEWVNITTDSPDIQTGGTRAVIAGGYENPGAGDLSSIEYVNIDTTGNATTFGNLTSARRGAAPMSSRTRAVFAGGYTTSINYVTISSTGAGANFGSLAISRQHIAGLSNSTRGIVAGGYVPSPGGGTDEIEYITIASEGSTLDFGSLSSNTYFSGGCGSSTRGLIAHSTSLNSNTIEFITINTLGNAADFGDLTVGRRQDANQSASNSIRGIFGGAYATSGGEAIDYVTIATLGDAIDFGDMLNDNIYLTGASSPTRVCYMGGRTKAAPNFSQDTMQYVQIMTTGNAIDFGDLITARSQPASASNGHGGLG